MRLCVLCIIHCGYLTCFTNWIYKIYCCLISYRAHYEDSAFLRNENATYRMFSELRKISTLKFQYNFTGIDMMTWSESTLHLSGIVCADDSGRLFCCFSTLPWSWLKSRRLTCLPSISFLSRFQWRFWRPYQSSWFRFSCYKQRQWFPCNSFKGWW